MIPTSTFFIGLNGLIALILSYIALWNGSGPDLAWESKEDVVMQPDPLALPTACYLQLKSQSKNVREGSN